MYLGISLVAKTDVFAPILVASHMYICMIIVVLVETVSIFMGLKKKEHQQPSSLAPIEVQEPIRVGKQVGSGIIFFSEDDE